MPPAWKSALRLAREIFRRGLSLLSGAVCLFHLLSGATRGDSLNSSPFRAWSVSTPEIQPSILIFNPPVLEAAGWRITWISVPGRTYVLQRWTGLGLHDRREPRWTDLVTVGATGPTSFAHAVSARDHTENYYRVVELAGPGPQSAAALRLQPPIRLATGGWRLTWNSVPFQRYELQRWHSENLSESGIPSWLPVAEVTATGETAFADDVTGAGARGRFYRVVQLATVRPADMAGPVLAGFRADLLGVTASARVRLSVNATDPSGVREVVFLLDDVPLAGQQRSGDDWSLEVAFSSLQGATRLTARATDNANNSTSATIAPPSPATATSRFAALDANGKPIPGSTVNLTSGAPLPAIEFRPSASLGAGAEQTLVVKLAPGAMLAESGGREVIRFTNAELRFGRDSALQFDVLPRSATAQAAAPQSTIRQHANAVLTNGTIRITSATPLELPAGPLTATDLEALLGLAPGAGVPIMIYGKFPLRWHAGVLEDAGIRGGRFGFDGLPLPALSGDYPEFLAPLDARGEFRLPFYGDFEFADGSPLPPLARVSPADPAWLILRADGSIAYHNRSEFNLPFGGKFRADVKFDHPVYRIQIFADGIQVPMLGSLAQLLPPDPAVCVTNATTSSELNLGTRCLMAFDQAVYNFAASAAASAPISTNVNAGIPPTPPDDVDTALSILDAWSHAAATPLITALPMDELRELLRHTGEAAEASGDLESVVRHRRALVRALAAVEEGGLSGSAESRAELESALAAAEAAAALRVRDPNAVNSLQSLRETLRALVETQELLAQANRPPSIGIHEAFGPVIQQFLDSEFRALGVEPGQFTSAPGSPIATMNRFVVFQTLRDLLDVLAIAAALGVDDQLDVLFREAAAQMALRLWTLLDAAFAEAETARDIPGFQFALEDFLDFEALRQFALFPDRPELNAIPQVNTAAFNAIINRLGLLYAADLALPYPARSLVNETTQLRRLIRILRDVPPTVTFAAEPFARAYGRVNEKLAEAMSRLSSISSLSELLALVEAGLLGEALRLQFDLTASANWDGERLPQLIERLAGVAQQQRGWSELHRAFELLRAEADRIGSAGDQARRKIYLQQSVPVLRASRAAAVAMWESERVRRELDSPLNVADLLLPGEIRIDKVAGGAGFNVKNGQFDGFFKGEMRLPKFNGRLNVLNASFNSTGEFDLRAFGTFTFQQTTVSVPRRQPLHLSFRAPRDLAFTGEAMLALPNGMSFAARLTLDDPLYGFRIEARDLRLELAKQLSVFRPTLDMATLSAAGTDLRGAFIDYFTGLNTSLEALAGVAAELPEVDTTQIGEPPAYEVPQLTIPFSQLNAFANSVLLDVERGLNRSYAFVTPDLKGALTTLRDDAALAAETFESESRFLENQLARLEQQRRISEALEKAADRMLLGVDNIADLLEEASAGTRQEAVLHAQYLRQHPPKDLAETTRNAMAILDIGAAQAALNANFDDVDGDGVPNDVDPCPAIPLKGGQAFHPDQDNDGVGDDCDPAPNDAAIPGAGPCATYLKLAGQPLLQVQALLACQLPKEYAALGIDFNTGNVTNQMTFNGFTADDLELKVILLSHLEGEVAAAGVEGGPLDSLQTTIQRRLLQLKSEQLQNVPVADHAQRYDLALQMAEIRSWAGDAIGEDEFKNDLLQAAPFLTQLSDADMERLERTVAMRKDKRDERLKVAVARDFGAETTGGIDLIDRSRKRGVVGDTLVLLKVLFVDDPDESVVYRERVDAFIRYKVQQLKARSVETDYLANRLIEGESIARTLADFTGWVAEFAPSGNETLVEDLRVAWQDWTIQFTTAAEAKRAWWLLRRYELLLHEAVRDYEGKLNAAMAATLRQAFATSTLASGRIADALVALADSVGVEQVTFKLPGDLRVRRAFGGIEYNRETEVLTGMFGGRVEFPELQNAFFEISNATIATDGSFNIAAATGGPLPFGNLRANTSLNVVGSLAGLQTVSGAGQLFVPLNTTTQLYNVNLGYNFNTKQLSFDSTGAGLDLRLTDDFVLFNGGVGFDLSFAEPAGALRFSGSAGMFARQKPLPDFVTRTNFHLLVTNAAVRLALNETSFTTTLTNGAILLPEFFRTSLCATNRILTNYLASPKGTNSVLTNFVSMAAIANPTNPPPGTFGPSISLSTTNPISVAVQFDPPSVAFSGEVLFRDLGLQVPGFETLELAVCNARLIFPTNQLPVLTNFYAALQFPLPGQTNIVEVVDGAWALDGFPTGTIRLRTNVDVFDVDDWRLTLLGTESPECPLGTGITLGRQMSGVPFLRVDAGVEFAAPATLFSDQAGTGLSAAACGSLFVPFNEAPQFFVNTLAVSNRLVRLGGANGVTLTNMVLKLDGLTNIFNQSPETPLTAGLTGTVLVGPSTGLGLSNAVFHFEGGLVPRFTVSELAVIQPGAIFGLNEYMPLVLDEGRIRFLKDDLPIPALFAITNLATTISGSVALPPGPEPVVGGRVKDLTITFLPNGVPQFSLDAIGFTVDLTMFVSEDFPLALGGQMYMGGLNDPPNFLFSGKLRGNYKGNAIEGLVALDPCGLRGVCFGLAGAEVSIQLVYGFVLTGAKGGVSFVNSNANPCDFLSYLPIDPVTGRPLGGSTCNIEIPTNCPPEITMQEVQARRTQPARSADLSSAVSPTFSRQSVEESETVGANESDAGWKPAIQQAENLRHGALSAPQPGSSRREEAHFQIRNPKSEIRNRQSLLTSAATPQNEPFPCPGDCPPAAVNIYCMPHPDHEQSGSPHTNRVVMKFSAIDEATLNFIGITPEFVSSLVPDFSVNRKAVAIDLANMLRGFASSLTPRPPTGAPPLVQAAAALIEEKLDEMALAFANSIHCVTAGIPANSAQAATLIYNTIRDVAWAGVPCPDATVLLQGSVSYTGVSTFANVQGGVVLSTTGSAGVIGAVNVFGIPVGTARVFINQTDANGNPMLPSLCGQIHVGVGPFELGSMAALEDCPGCIDEFITAFTRLGTTLGNAYVYEIMLRAAPSLADAALTAPQHLARLTTMELQYAFATAMFASPPRDALGQVPAAFIEFTANLADAFLPRLSMCGEVNPKLFGFSLAGGNRLYSAKFYSGPKFVDGEQQDSYLMFYESGFSPSQMFAYTLLSATGSGSVLGMFAPALDEAVFSTTFELPALGDLVRDSFVKTPPQIALERFDDFLSDAVTTYTYRLAPLGMELGRASGRILMPSLRHHPRGPSPRPPPVLRGQGLPGPTEVLLAALGDKDQTNAVNRLGDGTWKGEGNADFAAIFAGSPYASAVANRNLSLRDDYFPHGGFLGAGTMDLPALLTAPLPESLFTALDGNAAPVDRLTALQDFFFDHLLATERVGEVSFYLPAPNPPLDRFPATAQELLESFRNFIPEDPRQFSNYYPLNQAFLTGWLDAPILGVPTARSRVSWRPEEGVFRLEAEVPANSWFNQLIGTARFVIDLRNNSNQVDTVTATFTPMSNQVARLRPTSATLTRDLDALTRPLPEQLANGLPKVSMELTAARVRIPVPTYVPNTPLPALQTVATLDNATLGAYSPYFRKPNATSNNPLDLARRDGGFAIKGDFNFLNGAVVAEDAEFSVTPNPAALGLPALHASFTSGTLNLFGVPIGPPVAQTSQSAALQSALAASPAAPLVEFSSDASRVRLSASGSVTQFPLGPLFTLKPITGNSVGVTALFETTTSALPTGSLAIGPCKIESLLFASSTNVLVHGPTTNDAFSISSTGPWTASVTIPAGEGINLYAGNQRVLRLGRTAAAANQPFRATLSGTGTTYSKLQIDNLSLGVVVQTYPDAPIFPVADPRRRAFFLNAGASVSFSVDSAGAFDLRATIPSAVSLTGTPLANLQGGFELRLNNDGLRFIGTADGGVFTSLGGTSLSLDVLVTAAGFNFTATARLPKLIVGIFDLHELVRLDRVGPSVTVTASGITLLNNIRVQVNSSQAGNPHIALASFTIASNGSFDAVGTHTVSWQGVSLGSASVHVIRTPAGVVSLAATGSIEPRTLSGFGSIQPVTGTRINAALALASDGTGTLSVDPAKLRLDALGVTVDGTIHGAAGVTQPFTFSSLDPWSAAVTYDSFVGDPLTDFPEFVRLTPASGGSLFTASLTGHAGNLVSFNATRSGNVNFTLLKDSPMERAFNNVNVGTASFALTNNPRQLVVTLDPPDISFTTNVVSGQVIFIVPLFELSGGLLRCTLGSGGAEKSLKLETPSLTLLPGSFLEQSLTNLPIQELVSGGAKSEGTGSAFRIFTDTPVRQLSFRGLPVITLPAGTGSALLTLTPAGFSVPGVVQMLAANYSGLLSFANQTAGGGLRMDFSGTKLTLKKTGGFSATVLGASLSLTGGDASFEVSTTGSFNATFTTTSNPSRNLGFNLLSFQPGGTLAVGGNANVANPSFSLAGNFSLQVAYPDPDNPTSALTIRRDFTFDLEAGENFSATLTSGLPSFDLGWLRVEPGSDGEVAVSRNAATGAFSVGFNNWDVYLFGQKSDNQDFTLATDGTLTEDLTNGSFDFGSGTSLMRLASSDAVDFSWRANPSAANSTRIEIDFPSTMELFFPSVAGLIGTLKNGVDLGSGFPDLNAPGTFDYTWGRTLTINTLDFGSCSVNFKRTTQNGTVNFTATKSNALGLTGLNLSVSANSSSATSFSASLTGTFSLTVGSPPNAVTYTFASVNLSLNASNPTYPFQGTATIDGLGSQTLRIGSAGISFVRSGISLGPFPLP